MKFLLGIGNPLKSDDNIGQIVVENLNVEGFEKFLCSTTPENYLGKLENADLVVIVDAVDFNGKTGEVRLFETKEFKSIGLTTHNLPLEYYVKFVGENKVKVIGIQPAKIEYGEEISEELKRRLDMIITKIEEILKCA